MASYANSVQDSAGCAPSRPLPCQPARWLEQIKELLLQGRAGVRDLARTVYAARRSLQCGEWSALWNSRTGPFSKRKAEMLSAVGKAMGDLDAQTFAQLPPGWSILYQLSKLTREQLLDLMAQGRITDKLTLKRARQLVCEANGLLIDPEELNPASIKAKLRNLRAFVEASLAQWSAPDREHAITELELLAAQISGLNPPIRF